MTKHIQARETEMPGGDARSAVVYERAVQRTTRLNARTRQMKRDLRADALAQDRKAPSAPIRGGTAWQPVLVPIPALATGFLPSPVRASELGPVQRSG